MDIKIKELEESDLEKFGPDFYKTLDNLKPQGEFDLIKAKHILHNINSCEGHVFVAIVDNQRLVGTCTLFLEPKFLRNGVVAAHMEDLSVMKEFEGKAVASLIAKKCVEFAKEKGCYRLILDCKDNLVKFYGKFGFQEKAVCMKLYFDEEKL